MAPISILVLTASPDIKADGIIAAVHERRDMQLLCIRQLHAKEEVEEQEVADALDLIPNAARCALVIVGRPRATSRFTRKFLTQRPDLFILQVDIVGDNVRIALADPGLDELLDALPKLVDHFGDASTKRIKHVQFGPGQSPSRSTKSGHGELLKAARSWVKSVLTNAVAGIPDENGDAHGFSATRTTLLQQLHPQPDLLKGPDRPDENPAEEALDKALCDLHVDDGPLAAATYYFGLQPPDFKLLALALAPEMDVLFQRCLGLLLDDMSRRTGTLPLYYSLLQDSGDIRAKLARSGAVWRWLVFESRAPAPDEPLRADPFLAQWLLAGGTSLECDPRVRRLLRTHPWPGASILERGDEHATAARFMNKLTDPVQSSWLVLGGNDPESWRALLELGADDANLQPLRVEAARFAGLDELEVEDCAWRIARLALLTRRPLMLDVADNDAAEGVSGSLERFLVTLNETGCRGAIICPEPARLAAQLACTSFELVTAQPLPPAGRLAAFRAAARRAGAYLTLQTAENIARRYPLTIDRLEQAMHLAIGRPLDDFYIDRLVKRFTTACGELAVEGLGNLADLIEPAFQLEDVVLPSVQKSQLTEIVDHVRLAPKVLDGWKFGERLPYGRGVAALFFGPSGTGKTMAAMGIARALGIPLLRIDLSRIVSKYIGDTEKNIDRVFTGAQRSGAAILIDEADALLGKRSEVKDAHDRYANIEVAYLLQRMESYEGLAILTSNLRQNLDAAFVRRLRFMVDFPRPDLAAREQIWRFCLPAESHDLDDAAFRHLARKIDLTGGHIRQITLRAAFFAAAANQRINLEHVAQGARAEFAKLGLPPVEIDLTVGRRAA